MSATYNWAYKPGVTNKYGLTVPAGADNVRPSGYCYVAIFGNDITGNGSRQYPYRTINKACTLAGITIVLGSGVYRESTVITTLNNMVGDGDVIVDISYNNYLYNQSANSFFINNIRFKGNGVSSYVTSGFYATSIFTDVYFEGCYIANTTNYSNRLYSCIVSNFSGAISSTPAGGSSSFLSKNNTFINCNNIQYTDTFAIYDACIFYGCNISFAGKTSINMQYSVFYNCTWKLNGTSNGGTLYPSTPAGYTYYATITLLQSAFTALYGGVSFNGCIISDPLFNNFNIGDYSLSFSSPAKNASYFGTYVGAKSIAYPIKARSTESAGGFDFSTAVNLTIADDSITLTNPALDAQIDTHVIVNAIARELANFPFYGFNADRNGQYIDSIADLDTVTKSPTDILTIPTPYIVETGAIVYNGVTYQPGERFTTVAGQTAFTTTVSGVVREILEAPQRHTIMARFGDGGSAITAGAALVSGYFYYVVSGSVTYDSVVYNAGSVFKAVDTNAFSGSGSVILAFSTENFQHYEPGIKPTSNNVGDTRTGAIMRGNGDPAYVRGGLGINEFPINAKFIQIRYFIRVSNLKL